MSTYESTVICSPELPAEKIDELVEKIKKVVETAGGKVAITQQLGKKRLSYPIKKFREGSYVYLELAGPGNAIAALENFYKVNDTIIRYLTVKAEKKKPPKQVPAPTPVEPAKPAQEEGKPHDTTNQPSAAGAE